MLSSRSGTSNPPPQEGTFTRIGEKVAHIATTQFSNLKDNIIAGAAIFKDGCQIAAKSRGRDDGTYETLEEKQASMERQNQAFDRIGNTAKDTLAKNAQAHKQISEDLGHISEEFAGIGVGAAKGVWEMAKGAGTLLETGARIAGAEMLYDSDVLSEQKEKYYTSQQGKEDCTLLINSSKAVANQTGNTFVGAGKMVYHVGGLRGVEEQKNEDWNSLQELNERNIRLGIEQEKHSAGLVEGFDLALPATSHFIRNINDPNSENIGGNFAHAALETTSVIGSIKTVGALINKTEKLAAQTLKGKAPLHSKSAVNIANSETSTLSELNGLNSRLKATTVSEADLVYNTTSNVIRETLGTTKIDKYRQYKLKKAFEADPSLFENKYKPQSICKNVRTAMDKASKKSINISQWDSPVKRKDLPYLRKKFLGDNHIEVVDNTGQHSGTWRSIDGKRQFRVKKRDYEGGHGMGMPVQKDTPHVHLEFIELSENGKFIVTKNVHIPLIEK